MAADTGPFIDSLTSTPHAFLLPTLPLYTDTLAYLKHTLDPLAADVSSVQQQRQQKLRKTRKRGQAVPEEEVLRLKQIHTDGFGVEQVWEQARRVVDAAKAEAQRGLVEVQLRQTKWLENGTVRAGVLDGHEVQHEEQHEGPEELGEEGVDYVVEGFEADGEENESSEDVQESMDRSRDYMNDGDFEMDRDESGEPAASDTDQPKEEFVSDKFGLNDGFFSIDEFNRRSEFLEQQDARGDDDGAASDEEDVDWDANPLARSAALESNGALNDGADRVNDKEEDEDGPTFGDPDAPSEDDDEEFEAGEMDDMGGMSNTNDILYVDFFAPPAQKTRKNKKGRPNPHNFPETNGASHGLEEDLERTIAGVHRDLFDDDISAEEKEEDQSAQDPADPLSRRSTHERRKAALAEEIRKLEAANVAKREWTLSGEARAADRPLNSLLEEDLDFERAGKPVPVITAEVSESIEDLVKRRVLAHEFQDLIRRRPEDLATGRESKRGRLDFELDDSRSKKGLAEEYEDEHLRRTDPNFVDVKDEKLKKEEKEIEALWNNARSELDSLSSWHFRPKQPAPLLDIRVDAPAINMEDARPSAGGEVATTSQLAPQEVYRAGEATEGSREEVVGRSGLPSGREELSREERKRRRRRQKERIRKAAGNQKMKVESRGAKEKKEVLGNLKRGSVKIIGKKGDMKDVDGRDVRTGTGQQGAGRFKL